MAKIAMMGSGNMGTALSVLLARNGNKVNLYCYEECVIDSIEKIRENKKYLAGVKLPKAIVPYCDVGKAMDNVDIVVLCVPSSIMSLLVKQIAPYMKKHMILVNTSKGIDEKTELRMTDLIKRNVPKFMKNRIVELSGPSIAWEIVRGVLTAVIVSSENKNILPAVKKAFDNRNFRVFAKHDIIGVEFGGFFKNIVAIAAGICDGMKHGINLKAAVITKAYGELIRLGIKEGAQERSFLGLAGLGDLIVTCFSHDSRNRRFGELIGKGYHIEEAKAEIGQVIEGLNALEIARKMAKKHSVKMPLIDELHKIVFTGKSAEKAFADFFKEGD